MKPEEKQLLRTDHRRTDCECSLQTLEAQLWHSWVDFEKGTQSSRGTEQQSLSQNKRAQRPAIHCRWREDLGSRECRQRVAFLDILC